MALSIKSKMQEDNMTRHHHLFKDDAITPKSKIEINNFLLCYFTSCQEAMLLCPVTEFVQGRI